MRISNSFSEGEIQVMEFIVQTLLRGGSPTMATRHKEFASLCRKVMAMKGKVLDKQRAAQLRSSVEGVNTPEPRVTDAAPTEDEPVVVPEVETTNLGPAPAHAPESMLQRAV